MCGLNAWQDATLAEGVPLISLLTPLDCLSHLSTLALPVVSPAVLLPAPCGPMHCLILDWVLGGQGLICLLTVHHRSEDADLARIYPPNSAGCR